MEDPSRSLAHCSPLYARVYSSERPVSPAGYRDGHCFSKSPSRPRPIHLSPVLAKRRAGPYSGARPASCAVVRMLISRGTSSLRRRRRRRAGEPSSPCAAVPCQALPPPADHPALIRRVRAQSFLPTTMMKRCARWPSIPVQSLASPLASLLSLESVSLPSFLCSPAGPSTSRLPPTSRLLSSHSHLVRAIAVLLLQSFLVTRVDAFQWSFNTSVRVHIIPALPITDDPSSR